MRYSIPILPVILFDSGMIISESFSLDAFKKHSSKVLQWIISAFELIDSAAKWEYAPNVPWK
jgi:hypothetical protein